VQEDAVIVLEAQKQMGLRLRGHVVHLDDRYDSRLRAIAYAN
jgi:hypothetical protein